MVVCTRERPGALARCLDSLLAQAYPDFRILVVDNAPVTDATAEVVRAAARRGPVEYLAEPKAGLSFARNAAVAAAPGEILAWIDDDEYADPHWLAEVARALADHPEADVVSGVIVPAELETQAQMWFEQFGGHSKGRGFEPDVFSPATAHIQSPLYPLPPFGTGANMTFRPGVIERIGGWDTALGAGTPAMGSEDTLAFTQVLLSGGTIVYQPTAVTHHYHRRDLEGLRQADGRVRRRADRRVHQPAAEPAGPALAADQAGAGRAARPDRLGQPAGVDAAGRLPARAADGQPARHAGRPARVPEGPPGRARQAAGQPLTVLFPPFTGNLTLHRAFSVRETQMWRQTGHPAAVRADRARAAGWLSGPSASTAAREPPAPRPKIA